MMRDDLFYQIATIKRQISTFSVFKALSLSSCEFKFFVVGNNPVICAM